MIDSLGSGVSALDEYYNADHLPELGYGVDSQADGDGVPLAVKEFVRDTTVETILKYLTDLTDKRKIFWTFGIDDQYAVIFGGMIFSISPTSLYFSDPHYQGSILIYNIPLGDESRATLFFKDLIAKAIESCNDGYEYRLRQIVQDLRKFTGKKHEG